MNQVFLTAEELRACQTVFEKMDTDRSGSIETWELKAALQSMGQDPSDEELFAMMADVDQDSNGRIEYGEFVRLVERQKASHMNFKPDTDTLEAFVALGGNSDKTGQLDVTKLRALIRELGLTVDIDKLIAEADTDGSGFVDFDEFAEMMRDE